MCRAAWGSVPANLLQAAHPPATHRHGTWARQRGQSRGEQTGRALPCTSAKPLPPQPRSSQGWWDFKGGRLPGSGGLLVVKGSQQWWAPRGGGISVVVHSKQWWAPSAGGFPEGSSQVGQGHKAHPAGPVRNLSFPQHPTPTKAVLSLSKRQDSHPAWQGQVEHQPASPGGQEQGVLEIPG